MKKLIHLFIVSLLVVANIFIAGCGAQKKETPKEEVVMNPEIKKAADDLNKQIDVLSADMKGVTAVLKNEMPAISQKIQGLVTELQQAAQEVQESLNSKESAAAKTQAN